MIQASAFVADELEPKRADNIPMTAYGSRLFLTSGPTILANTLQFLLPKVTFHVACLAVYRDFSSRAFKVKTRQYQGR
ncbi:MAG: hypothetical protein M1368_08585 [Thaumarchaeota archaeon]|nr:hypothetical protein [Nitrososphaerota archaeon]